VSRLRFAIQGLPIPAVSSAGDVDECVMVLPYDSFTWDMESAAETRYGQLADRRSLRSRGADTFPGAWFFAAWPPGDVLAGTVNGGRLCGGLS